MRKSETGAGQVGLLWVVFLIVLVLGLAGFTYIAFKDKANLELQYLDAMEKESKAHQKYQDAVTKLSEVSQVVGYRNEDVVGSTSALEAMNDVILGLKDKFPDHIATEAKTLDRVIEGMQSAYTDVEAKLGEARQSFDNELELRRTAEENINNIQTENSRRIAELEGQLSDEQQRSQTQQDEDNTRIGNLQTQLDESDSRMREIENTAANEKQRLDNELNKLTARIAAQAKKLEVLREPDQPDGTIISTTSGSGLAYIDVGHTDGLRRGTKFEVFRYGKGGVLLPKGWIEVRDLEEDSALCGIVKTFDRFDPIVNGDVITNPHFVRNMEKSFVFLGEFPSSMNKTFVKDRLVSLGATVADNVSSTTDFLVLGQKEKGEFAAELVDLPEYKLASQLGVQILLLKDLAGFIQY